LELCITGALAAVEVATRPASGAPPTSVARGTLEGLLDDRPQ